MVVNLTNLQNGDRKGSPTQVEDIVSAVLLSIVFLLVEGGNITVFIALLKQKIRGPIVLLLKALIVSTSLTGILYVLPSCLTILSSDWLHNTTLCTIQAFLKNTFVSWTSFLLALLSIERWMTNAANNLSRSKNVYAKITLGTLILSGLLQCVSFVSHHQYIFIPEMMSCDYQTGIGSVNYVLITSIIPCSVSLLLTFKDLCSNFSESSRVSPRGQRISFAVNHTVYRPTLVQIRDLNKKVKRNLIILQMLIAVMITFSSFLRLVSAISIGYCTYMKSIVWLINISGLLLPVFCIMMRKSLQRSFFMSDRHSVYPRLSHSLHIHNYPPRPRQDCKSTTEVPCFLKKKQSDIDISLQYGFNSEFNTEHCPQHNHCDQSDCCLQSDHLSQSDHCTKSDHKCCHLKKKMSELSLISYDIQIDKVNNERMSVNSCSESLDSVFVRVNTPHDNRSISITSRRESQNDVSSWRQTQLSSSEHSHANHMSSGSDVSCNRRQALPPLNFTITTCVPINGREVEQRRGSSSIKHSFSRRVSGFPLLTPVEDVGSLECSPRTSVESKQSSNYALPARVSRLNSCLQNLSE